MREFRVLEIDHIAETLYERLSAEVHAVYLYGSVARGYQRPRDLDLLLVIGSKGQITTVFAAIAEIQRNTEVLIHPTVISLRELQSNPLFRELAELSKVLWQDF